MPMHLLSMAALAHRAKNIYNPALFPKVEQFWSRTALSNTVTTEHVCPFKFKITEVKNSGSQLHTLLTNSHTWSLIPSAAASTSARS